ncbi:MAG: zinc-dependent metalloprotease [Actinomycetales bacterium]
MSEQPDEPTPAELEELMRRLASGQLSPDDIAKIQAEISSTLGAQLPPEMIQQAMEQMRTVMGGPDEGPVRWSMAADAARQVATTPTEDEPGDPTIDAAQQRAGLDALRTASMWLDGATEITATTTDERVWSRLEWVDATLPTWRPLCQPVAEQVSTALTGAMAGQLPEQFAAMATQASAMMRKMGAAMFGAQVGRAVGGLGREVVSAHDIGLPLAPAGTMALLPANIDAFAEGLEIPIEEVRLYLALRESAYVRLFAHAGWLRAHVLALVEEFARGITIDTDTMTEAVQSLDPTNPESLREALASGMFEPQRTPAQQAALSRLETTLALIEGWVDEVTTAAATGKLPDAAKLREAVRRRRAVGGPAEHTLATLVGLELRPRRLREAAALWAALAERHGSSARDEIWDHPDLMPTNDDLDDPLGYVERYGVTDPAEDELDAELRRLLDGEA